MTPPEPETAAAAMLGWVYTPPSCRSPFSKPAAFRILAIPSPTTHSWSGRVPAVQSHAGNPVGHPVKTVMKMIFDIIKYIIINNLPFDAQPFSGYTGFLEWKRR